MQSFLNVPPLLWLLFLVPLLFFIAGIIFMLRVYVRLYRKVQRDPDEALDSLLSVAERIGINTSDAVRLRDSIIGEKLKDFGIIEFREYCRKTIEYAGSLCRVEGRKQIVVRITEKIDKPRLTDLFSFDVEVTYCPLGQAVCKELANILGENEEVFLRKAAEGEAVSRSSETMERNRYGRLKDIFIRRLAFQPLKYFGIIDEASKSVPLTSGKEAFWFQRIGAYIGKEKDEILLVLELRAKLTAKGYRVKFLSPAAFNYKLYYPLGAPARQFLREILQTPAVL
jgi:hypothetical protein